MKSFTVYIFYQSVKLKKSPNKLLYEIEIEIELTEIETTTEVV